MLIAEDLLLLITDESGRLVAPALPSDLGLGGAILVELVVLHRADLSGAGDAAKPGLVVVRDGSPSGDAILDAALTTLASRRDAKPQSVIRLLGKNLRTRLYERLAAAGLVRAARGRTFGVFPVPRWPADDTRHADEVRRALTQALVQKPTPDPHTAALVALLHAMHVEHKIVLPSEHGLSARQLRARAGEIAEGDWASDAVRKAISETLAAIVAVTAAGAATTATGG